MAQRHGNHPSKKIKKIIFFLCFEYMLKFNLRLKKESHFMSNLRPI